LSADQRTYVISLASLAHIIINTLIVVILGSMQVNIVVLRFVAFTVDISKIFYINDLCQEKL